MATIFAPDVPLNDSFTWAKTSFSPHNLKYPVSLDFIVPGFHQHTLGSWINAPPLLLGGRSPVVAYLRHSMIV